MPWTILLTGVPLLVALLLLNLIGPVSGPLLGPGVAISDYFPGLITFTAAAMAQMSLCLGALLIFLRMFIRTCGIGRGPYVTFALIYGAVVLVLLALMPGWSGVAGELTFGTGARIFAESGTLWVHGGAGVSRLFLGYYLPSAFGVVATIAGATTMAALVRSARLAPEQDRPAIQERTRTYLRSVLYLLSLILVLSTLAASLYFHLPRVVLDGAERTVLLSFASEISLFWGAVYSMTLAAAVVPPFMLYREAILPNTFGKHPGGTGLSEADSLPRQFAQRFELMVTIMAPVVTGPLATLVQGALLA